MNDDVLQRYLLVYQRFGLRICDNPRLQSLGAECPCRQCEWGRRYGLKVGGEGDPDRVTNRGPKFHLNGLKAEEREDAKAVEPGAAVY